MENKKKLAVLLVAVIALITAGMLITGNKTKVEVIEAKPGTISTLVEDTALVQAAENYNLYASQNAKIVDIAVDMGQKIEKGRLIIKLENKELDANLNDTRSLLTQAEAAYDAATAALSRLELQARDAEAELGRSEKLYKNNAISRAEYEKAVLLAESSRQSINEQKANLKTLEAQIAGLQQSETSLTELEAELLVYSPIEGIILQLPVEEQQMVTAGTLLTSISRPDNLEIKADILSDDLKDVTVGQKVFINSPLFGDKPREGTVSQIYPQAEEKISALGVVQRRVPVIISLNETAKLQPGYEVRVAIETNRREDIIIVPIESIMEGYNGQKQVLLVENNKVKYTNIEIGLSDGYYTEVKSGLDDGSFVIRDGSLGLKENSRVEPFKES